MQNFSNKALILGVIISSFVFFQPGAQAIGSGAIVDSGSGTIIEPLSGVTANNNFNILAESTQTGSIVALSETDK